MEYLNSLKKSTVILRLALLAMSVIAIGLCLLILPGLPKGWTHEYAGLAPWRYVFTFGLGLTVLPFLVALFQAWKLLQFIDKKMVFSSVSVKALQNIKYAALIIALIYAAGLPLIYQVAQIEDAQDSYLFGVQYL